MSTGVKWEDAGSVRALINPAQRSPELLQALGTLPIRLNQWLVEDLRNLPYRTVRLQLPAGRKEYDLVVQIYTGRQRRKLERDSAAACAFHAAMKMVELDIETLVPLAAVEYNGEKERACSCFLMQRAENTLSFDSELVNLFHERPDFDEVAALVESIALAIRHMHAQGMRHGALCNRNILVKRQSGGQVVKIIFTDLFKASFTAKKYGRTLGADLAGLDMPQNLWRVFFNSYCGITRNRVLEWSVNLRRFNLCLRRCVPFKLRRPFHPLPPSALPEPSEQWLWDRKNHEAVNLTNDPARPKKRGKKRASVKASIIAGQVRSSAFQGNVSLEHFLAGGFSNLSGTLETEIANLKQLGIRDAAVCLCHNDTHEQRNKGLGFVHALSGAGFDVSGVLVQDRKGVREPQLWDHFANQVLSSAGWQLRALEFGHALNRSEWGVRNWKDYTKLMANLPILQDAYPGVAFVLPSIAGLDYKFVRKAYKLLPSGCHSDMCAIKMEEDDGWGGFSDAKLLQVCSQWLAELPRSGKHLPRLAVSEAQRLRPVGEKHDIATEAERLVRRILLLTCAGFVEQTTLWWLPALSNDAEHGPLLQAIGRLINNLAGGRFVRRLNTPYHQKVYLLLCENFSAQPVLVGWVDGTPLQVEASFRVASAIDIHGRTAPILPYPRLRLTSTPVFFYGA